MCNIYVRKDVISGILLLKSFAKLSTILKKAVKAVFIVFKCINMQLFP